MPSPPKVMHAMGEDGPIICLGSMDGGHNRCYEYALDHPERVKAVVAVGGVAPFNEFDAKVDFYGDPYADALANCRSVNGARKGLSNVYGFFAVGWGLITVVIPAGAYQPAARAYEMHFLNLFNEKQWQTQAVLLGRAQASPTCDGWMDPSPFEARPDLDASIPVVIFQLARTQAQLDKTCSDWGYSLGSRDCDFIRWQYTTTMNFTQAIADRNPGKSRFVLCTDCDADSGFYLNQGNDIPWFVDNMIDAVGNITKT